MVKDATLFLTLGAYKEIQAKSLMAFFYPEVFAICREKGRL
jgi:hypothetical protein